MPKAITMKPAIKEIQLLELDESGETTVTIRQATAGDMRKLGDLFSDQTQIWDDPEGNTVKIQKKWNLEELKRMRAYVTMVGCNIINEDTGGEWFTFRTGPNGAAPGNQSLFFSAWDALPPEVAQEIYEAVLVVNTQWDPAYQGE